MSAPTTYQPPVGRVLHDAIGGWKSVRIDGLHNPFELPDPDWVHDEKAHECTGCSEKFTLVHRKHHCRWCGRIFCDVCTEIREPVLRMCYIDPVRLCPTCIPVVRKDNHFFEHDFPVLYRGAVLNIGFDGGSFTKTIVKLSDSESHMLFVPNMKEDPHAQGRAIDVRDFVSVSFENLPADNGHGEEFTLLRTKDNHQIALRGTRDERGNISKAFSAMIEIFHPKKHEPHTHEGLSPVIQVTPIS